MTAFIRRQRENIIYFIIFGILFLAPVLSLYIHTTSDGRAFHWDEIFGVWKILTGFLVVFLIHNFLIAPLLIYRNKKTLYILSVAVLLSAFLTLQFCAKPNRPSQMAKELHGPVPPEFREHGIKRGEPGTDRPHKRPHHGHRPPIVMGQADVISLVILVFMLGMNLGVKLYFKTERNRKKLEQLEKENLTHQLEYLKFQINPHFFMNTLNNIHALIDIDPEQAKGSIIMLSKMMRYILYEGNKSTIPLQREIDFINTYISLMRMRYTDKVTISIDMPKDTVDGMEIPPLLLITFVENAFKHGVSYQNDSFIEIHLTVENGILLFNCRNSKAKEANQEQGGVGLVNVKKRLDLIYGDQYTLDIQDRDDTYNIELRIKT